MTSNVIYKNSGGFSLMEVLVAMGVMSILMVSGGSIFSYLNTQMKTLDIKYEISDLKRQLENGFRVNEAATCSAAVTGRTFDSTRADAKVNLRRGIVLSDTVTLRPGAVVPDSPNRLAFNEIQIEKFSLAGPNLYRGEITLTVDPATTKVPLKPILFTYLFNTNPASPATAVEIINCAGSANTCLAPQIQTGVARDGSAICQSIDDYLEGYIARLPACASGMAVRGYTIDRRTRALRPTCESIRAPTGVETCSPTGSRRWTKFCNSTGNWTEALIICNSAPTGAEPEIRLSFNNVDAESWNYYHRLMIPNTMPYNEPSTACIPD